MPDAPTLLALAVKVREQSGRPLDEAGMERMRNKISRMTAGEVTEQRAILRNLLGVAAKTPSRNQP